MPLNPNGTGADPHPPPVYLAAMGGHLEVVRLLLEAGADLNLQDEATALTPAAFNGQLEVVQLLLKAGADQNAQRQSGNGLDGCSFQWSFGSGADVARGCS